MKQTAPSESSQDEEVGPRPKTPTNNLKAFVDEGWC